jgi:hypothetical protein
MTVPVLTGSPQALLTASVEYAHVYADERLGDDHRRAARRARQLDVTDGVHVMLVDDYNVRALWRAATLHEQLAECPPDLIFSEADFESAARVLLGALPEGRARSGVERWMVGHGGKTPCSLLTAAWYLVRLGLMPGPLDRLRHEPCPPAATVVNVLPMAYARSEERTLGILEAYQPGLGAQVTTHWLNEDPFLHFKADPYATDNYGTPLEADRAIVDALGKAWAEIETVESAIEVGTGPNLYPVLVALPWVRQLRVTDFVPSNVSWARRQLDGDMAFWRRFHDYPAVVEDLRTKVTVERQDVYVLPRDTYDVVSMHSVMESITSSRATFFHGLRGIHSSLRSGGHLLASFMLGSTGWEVAGANFPAVELNREDILEELQMAGFGLEWDTVTPPVREGHQGLLFVKACRL